eukprot:1731094-Amphidinium_carterae.1
MQLKDPPTRVKNYANRHMHAHTHTRAHAVARKRQLLEACVCVFANRETPEPPFVVLSNCVGAWRLTAHAPGLTVLAVVISAVIEGLFCVLLFNMTKSPVGEENVTQLLSWRVRHGQNVEYLGTYSTSLTRRLCLGELSMEAAALQHGVNSQFIDYLANQSGSLPINGVWLSALTNALWTFFFLKELKSIGAFV